MIPGRRRCLAALILGLAAGPTFAQGSPGKTSGLLQRWPTGNATLAPVTAAGKHILCAGEQAIALVDVARRNPLWQRAHGLPEGAVFRPRVANGVAVCAGQQAVGAWQLATGKPLWRHDARAQIGVPCVTPDRAFFGDGHELVCLDLASGKPRWRFAAIADTQISYAPTVSGDAVFVGPGDGRLYALNTANGSVRWTLDRMAEWQYLRQLHVDGNVLVGGSYKEILYGIDCASGKVLWTFNAGNFINSHHVANGVAYLWSPTGWLYAIDVQTGAVRWRHLTTDYRGGGGNWASLMAELVTRDNRLYALDLDNVLHVLDTASGKEIGRSELPEAVRPFVLPLSATQMVFGAESGELLLASLD